MSTSPNTPRAGSTVERVTANVQRILDQYGWSRQNLADAMCVDKGNLSRTLRGRHSPGVSYVQRIALALKVDISELFRKS